MTEDVNRLFTVPARELMTVPDVRHAATVALGLALLPAVALAVGVGVGLSFSRVFAD